VANDGLRCLIATDTSDQKQCDQDRAECEAHVSVTAG
jgi:hypothetical protein